MIKLLILFVDHSIAYTPYFSIYSCCYIFSDIYIIFFAGLPKHQAEVSG